MISIKIKPDSFIFCIVWFLLLLPFTVINASTTTILNLELVSTLPLPGNARSVALKGNLAYISLIYDGLAIVDISNPETPRLIRHIRQGLSPMYLAIEGDICFEGDRNRGLQVLDLSEPTSPIILSKINSPPMVLFVHLAKDYIYLACGGDGLMTLQRFPQKPFARPSSRFTKVDYSKMVAVREPFLFLADTYESGLKIYDISVPSTPTLVARYSALGSCDVLALNKNTLFVSKRQAGVIIADITTPQTPKVIGRIFLQGGALKDLKVSNNLLFVAHTRAGVSVYDIAEPSSPKFLRRIKTPGRPENITIRNNLIYVADWEGGLSIIRFFRRR